MQIGSGVILALGFMHLLPTAFENLLDPAVTETYNLPLDAAFPYVQPIRYLKQKALLS